MAKPGIRGIGKARKKIAEKKQRSEEKIKQSCKSPGCGCGCVVP